MGTARDTALGRGRPELAAYGSAVRNADSRLDRPVDVVCTADLSRFAPVASGDCCSGWTYTHSGVAPATD